jgi:hypothetical protein
MDRRGKIVLWSAQTGQLLALAEPVSIYDTNRGIAFSPDDSMLVTTSSVEDQRITALLIGILGTLLSIFSGLVQGGVSLKTFPNQGIRLSLKHAVLIGIGFGLIVSIIFTIMTYISLGDAGRIDYNDIYVVVALGGMATLIAGAWYGGLDIIQHYSLRLVLGLNGSIPWNYERFLDYAANRIFLRRVGGGYIFVHRLLMEHFAEMYSEDEKAK